MKENNKGIKHEKSALSNFAEKYVIDGKPGLTALQYFAKIVTQLKEFLRNHRNIKVRMILVCEMEQQIIEKVKGKSKINFSEDKAYFQSETHVNLEKTDVKVILSRMLREIMIKLALLTKEYHGDAMHLLLFHQHLSLIHDLSGFFFPVELLFTYRTFFIPQTGQVQ